MVGTPSTVKRGEVYLVTLDPTRGREIQKTRPCAIVSPDELNEHMATFIAVPLTTGTRKYPFRLPCKFAGKQGYLVLDQIRVIDRDRLVRKLGRVSPQALSNTLSTLQVMFSP